MFITVSETDVASAMQGDCVAFSRVVDSTKTLVSSIALAIVRDVPAAQDVAQDVYVSAWRALPKLRNATSFVPWIRQLTRNTAKQFLRRKRVEHKHLVADADALLHSAADPRADYCTEVVSGEQLELVRRVMDALPDDAREVVVLFYREDRSVKQVASLLDLTEVAVKKRLSRARERLREELAEDFYESLRRSAPNAAFTAAVASAVSLAAPGTAAAAGLTMAKGVGAAGTAAAGGFLVGAVGGLAGIFVGHRYAMRDAISVEEKRGVRLVSTLSVALTFLLLLATRLELGREGQLVMTVFFAGGMAALYNVWIPRILAPRFAAERAIDPTAEARQRRHARLALVGSASGGVCALGAVIYALYLR